MSIENEKKRRKEKKTAPYRPSSKSIVYTLRPPPDNPNNMIPKRETILFHTLINTITTPKFNLFCLITMKKNLSFLLMKLNIAENLETENLATI